MTAMDLTIDVTEAAGLGEPAHIAMTVTLPDPATLADTPVVCFAKPGGGYSRGYYTVDLPGPGAGAQADWHATRGWIFVSVDHLGVGDSSQHDGALLDYTVVAAASQAAELELLARLAAGTLHPDFPQVTDPLRIGIGQSMGGCMTIIQQGRYHCYDGIGVLGYSAIHTHPPTMPGTPPIVAAWIPRDRLLAQPLTVLNADAIATAAPLDRPFGDAMAWGFHYDDVPRELIAQDLAPFNRVHSDLKTNEKGDSGGPIADGPSPWASFTFPGAVAQTCLTPGTVAPEAAAVRVPVLCAMGERDVIADPRGEPRAFLSARSVDLFICPRMGHMHNFAGTRELFWQRIESFVGWARSVKSVSG